MFDGNGIQLYGKHRDYFYKVRHMHINPLPYYSKVLLALEEYNVSFLFSMFHLVRRNCWENIPCVYNRMGSEKTM